MKIVLTLYKQNDEKWFLRLDPHITINEDKFRDLVIMKTMTKCKLSKYPQYKYWNRTEVQIDDDIANVDVEEILSSAVAELMKKHDNTDYIFEVYEDDNKILFRFVNNFIFLAKNFYGTKIKSMVNKEIDFTRKLNSDQTTLVKCKIYEIENGNVLKKLEEERKKPTIKVGDIR